ncbi:C4-dicarboxylate ABC transporter substrate-binding protein [Frankia sp. AiPs1]|uniref:C4-dicarboxylate ABC transporter substrate-binding protein n=1 Tax=Frankia sp. AiPs1 TaxID=573493 RepID=UPI0020437C64|nr:C4-dicarboxylate ABC transporter substrate-binding protein [Frankia sp. AiPs1]MCM3923709.1 C4-dicarboxylate ABC transporter substrate-binding protein [Frankia sp. AiPs1]
MASSSSARPRKRPRTAAALAVGLLAASLLVVLLVPARGSSHDPGTRCRTVRIYSGQANSPYWVVAQELGRELVRRHPGWGLTVDPVATDGSADNIYRLQDDGAAACSLAMVQLNVAVDATFGIYQFDYQSAARFRRGTLNQVNRLRTLGPSYFDLVHVIVRRGEVSSLRDLCGKTVSGGLELSGSLQMNDVLFDNVCALTPPALPLPHVVYQTLGEGMDSLTDPATSTNPVQAVVWVAAPSGILDERIRRLGSAASDLQLLPIDRYREGFGTHWDRYYERVAGAGFVRRDGAPGIFADRTISAGTYSGMNQPTATIGAPNGLVARDTVDPGLAVAAARIMADRPWLAGALGQAAPAAVAHAHSDALESDTHADSDAAGEYRQLWRNPVFCLVPVLPAVATALREYTAQQHCGLS